MYLTFKIFDSNWTFYWLLQWHSWPLIQLHLKLIENVFNTRSDMYTLTNREWNCLQYHQNCFKQQFGEVLLFHFIFIFLSFHTIFSFLCHLKSYPFSFILFFFLLQFVFKRLIIAAIFLFYTWLDVVVVSFLCAIADVVAVVVVAVKF